MGPGPTDNSRRFTLLAEIAVILAPVLMIVWGTPLLIEDKRRRDAVDLYLMVAAGLIGLAVNRHRRDRLPEVATFIGGFFWTRTFQRHPNLIVIGLSHGFMSALLSNSLPHAWLPSMKVGWGFFN